MGTRTSKITHICITSNRHIKQTSQLRDNQCGAREIITYSIDVMHRTKTASRPNLKKTI
jgi:hypothetical protein